MYIVAVAWLYVVFMMSITEHSVTAALATFLLYGLFPLSIILYLMDAPRRRRKRRTEENLRVVHGESDRITEDTASSS